MYFVRTPYIIKKLFSHIIWEIPNNNNNIYLTFDDGPHPEITPWIIEQLKNYKIKATFFCSGQNIQKYPELFFQIIEAGHKTGNHSFSHLNGWASDDSIYIEDIMKAQLLIDSFMNRDDKISIDNQNERKLFRPPYGRIKRTQMPILTTQFKIVNWTLMPGDFDENISSFKCYSNLQSTKTGDIIVLHDNEKSWKHLNYCLPRFLEEFKSFNFELLK